MTSNRVLKIAALMAGILAALPVWAQRTAKGESFLSMDGTEAIQGTPGWGAHVSYGRYGLGFYWKAGAGTQGYIYDLTGLEEPEEDMMTSCRHITAHAGALYRLMGTYSRNLCLYAGGCVTAGYVRYGLHIPEPEEDGEGLSDGFTYGIRPELEAEIFLLRRAALVVGAQVPVYMGASLQDTYGKGTVHLRGTVGIRINF